MNTLIIFYRKYKGQEKKTIYNVKWFQWSVRDLFTNVPFQLPILPVGQSKVMEKFHKVSPFCKQKLDQQLLTCLAPECDLKIARFQEKYLELDQQILTCFPVCTFVYFDFFPRENCWTDSKINWFCCNNLLLLLLFFLFLWGLSVGSVDSKTLCKYFRTIRISTVHNAYHHLDHHSIL